MFSTKVTVALGTLCPQSYHLPNVQTLLWNRDTFLPALPSYGKKLLSHLFSCTHWSFFFLFKETLLLRKHLHLPSGKEAHGIRNGSRKSAFNDLQAPILSRSSWISIFSSSEILPHHFLLTWSCSKYYSAVNPFFRKVPTFWRVCREHLRRQAISEMDLAFFT